jgi:hypothetical protein
MRMFIAKVHSNFIGDSPNWEQIKHLILSVLLFHCCDKIPEKSKVGMIYFGSEF